MRRCWGQQRKKAPPPSSARPRQQQRRQPKRARQGSCRMSRRQRAGQLRRRSATVCRQVVQSAAAAKSSWSGQPATAPVRFALKRWFLFHKAHRVKTACSCGSSSAALLAPPRARKPRCARCVPCAQAGMQDVRSWLAAMLAGIRINLPVMALLALLFIYCHLVGLVAFAWLTYALHRMNLTVRAQVALKGAMQRRPLAAVAGLVVLQVRLLRAGQGKGGEGKVEAGVGVGAGRHECAAAAGGALLLVQHGHI